ncbi:MAG: acetyl-CoA carboxylase biotin carboxyl carrier protein [Candidatus Brocadiia bacterium]
MDVIEKIRELVELMSENELAELELEEPELRVRIKTNTYVQLASGPSSSEGQQVPVPVPAGSESERQLPEPNEGAESGEGRDEDLLEITAPMVGTFYRAPSEGAEPYVTVGTIVEPDSVVCIVEAMKVMNEVKAEVAGEVVEILVQNAEPVEFGQVLFLAEPAEE